MEMAQLSRSTHNNQLQQSINLCQKRNMSQIWQMNTLYYVWTNVPNTYQPCTHFDSEIWPGQDFKGHCDYSKVKDQVKVAP